MVSIVKSVKLKTKYLFTETLDKILLIYSDILPVKPLVKRFKIMSTSSQPVSKCFITVSGRILNMASVPTAPQHIHPPRPSCSGGDDASGSMLYLAGWHMMQFD